MRRENGILVFENYEEEEKSICKGGYQGILIARRPGILNSCDVIEVFPEKMKVIGNIDSGYLYGGNKNKDLEKEIVKILLRENPASMELGIPEIAISNGLRHIFGV